MEIQWLDTAREDMLALYGWYVKESPEVAAKLYRSIGDDVALLADNPRIGHHEPLLEGLEYEFRTLVASSRNHKIIYFIDENTVFIFRIWDCRQQPAKLRHSGLLKKK